MASDKTTASFDAVTSKLSSLSAKDETPNASAAKGEVKPVDDKGAAAAAAAATPSKEVEGEELMIA